MEIRASTTAFAERKAKQKRNEEKQLYKELNRLQYEIKLNYSESIKSEINKVKKDLMRIVAHKTQGAMIRSKAQWYEFDERNSKISICTI